MTEKEWFSLFEFIYDLMDDFVEAPHVEIVKDKNDVCYKEIEGSLVLNNNSLEYYSGDLELTPDMVSCDSPTIEPDAKIVFSRNEDYANALARLLDFYSFDVCKNSKCMKIITL